MSTIILNYNNNKILNFVTQGHFEQNIALRF